MKIFFSLIISGILFLNLNAQAIKIDHFSDSQKYSFAKIYLESKKHRMNVDSLAQIAFQNSGLSDQKIKEIIASGVNLEKRTLNDEEKSLKDEMGKLQNRLEKEKTILIEELCTREKLDLSVYQFMVSEFKNNLQFHNDMKPYFIRIIEGL